VYVAVILPFPVPLDGLILTQEQLSLAVHVLEPFDVTAMLLVPEEDVTELPDGTDTVHAGVPVSSKSSIYAPVLLLDTEFDTKSNFHRYVL